MLGTLTRAMRLTNDGNVVGVVFPGAVTFRSSVGRPPPPHAAAITMIAVTPARRTRRRCTVGDATGRRPRGRLADCRTVGLAPSRRGVPRYTSDGVERASAGSAASTRGTRYREVVDPDE